MDYSSQIESASGKKPKSFWRKPEGITGMLFLAALAAGGLWVWDKVLPWLIRITENTLYLGILLAVLAGLTYVLLSPEFRTGVFYLFKMAMRALTGLVIKIDPIAILKVYIDEMKKNRDILEQQITSLSQQEGKLRNQINKNNEQIENLLPKASKAKEKGLMKDAGLSAHEAGALQSMNQRLQPLYEKISKMLVFLEKLLDGADFHIRKTETDVRLMEMEYNVVKGSLNAIRSALRVFRGDPDKRRMFDSAVEYITDDVGAKLGEIKRAMQISEGIINGIDIEQGVATDKALEMLTAYEKGEFTLMSMGEETPVSLTPSEKTLPNNRHDKLLNS